MSGRGSAPNTAGYVELDASIMDGATREAGAVAAIVGVVNPISVARGVLRATPHVMLAGQGALAFAKLEGFELVEDPDNYYVLPVGVYEDEITEQKHGTVGAVALDTSGGLAAATSTGGTLGKLEGRVGDSPLIGPGTWARISGPVVRRCAAGLAGLVNWLGIQWPCWSTSACARATEPAIPSAPGVNTTWAP